MKLNFAQRQLMRELALGVLLTAALWGGMALYLYGCGCVYYATTPPVLVCR